MTNVPRYVAPLPRRRDQQQNYNRFADIEKVDELLSVGLTRTVCADPLRAGSCARLATPHSYFDSNELMIWVDNVSRGTGGARVLTRHTFPKEPENEGCGRLSR